MVGVDRSPPFSITEFIPALKIPTSDRISKLSPTISTTKSFHNSGNESLQVKDMFREQVGLAIHLENDLTATYVHIVPFRATLVDLFSVQELLPTLQNGKKL